ncbi:MAG: hypothetical protein ACRD5M_03975 [Candidatus Acidiferrales bacterium]
MSMETKLRAPQPVESAGYEHSDADVPSLVKFGLTLLVILVVVSLSMWRMFLYFAKSQQLGPPASPFENARVLPPQPRLQVQPQLDLRMYCEGQLQLLNTYGWVDPQNDVVRIPVDRAMDLIIQRGLPARSVNGAPSGEAEATEAEKMPAVSEAGGLQGPCGYLVGPPAPKEEK